MFHNKENVCPQIHHVSSVYSILIIYIGGKGLRKGSLGPLFLRGS